MSGASISEEVIESNYTGKYIILIIVLTGVFMSVLDGIVVNIALPTMTTYFHVKMAQSQWIMTAYLLTMTSLLLIGGKVSDYIGKTRLFIAGLSIFTLGSLACALSRSLTQLIAFRVVQAVGAASVFSISSAIIYQVFPAAEIGRAMGYLGSTVAIGSISGPMLGGILVDKLGWEYIFLINVPIGIVLLFSAARYLRIQETKSKRFEMDWIGAVSLVFSLVCIMLFLGGLAKQVAFTGPIFTCAVLFVIALVIFILRESMCRAPLLSLSVFKVKRFTLPIASTAILFIANFMMAVVRPFYFEGVMGYSPSHVGMVYMIVPSIMAVTSPLSGWLYDRYHSRFHASSGMLAVAISLIFLGYASTQMDMALIVPAFIIMGLGGALFQSPNNTEIMNALPKSQTAIASSATATMRNLGMALGVSIASIMVAVQLNKAGYRGDVLKAGPVLLSQIVGNVMYSGGFLCIIGTVISVLRAF